MMVYCISKIFGNNWSSMFNTFNERTLVILLNYLLNMESKFSGGQGISKFVPELQTLSQSLCLVRLRRARGLMGRDEG